MSVIGAYMQTISAYILAFNEAAKIKAAIETVLWADEIIVVDSESTDGTRDIAAALGARVVQVPFAGFGDLPFSLSPAGVDSGSAPAERQRSQTKEHAAHKLRAEEFMKG